MTSDTLRDAKSIYLIGIGGIGVSALARWLMSRQKKVSGSDREKSLVTDALIKEGAKLYFSQDGGHISKEYDLVITSQAIQKDHPEVVEAKRLGLTVITYPQAVGYLTQMMPTVCVAGTNGKTTTAAMLAKIYTEAGRDPNVLVGSLMNDFGKSNVRIGKGEVFILEADEYREAFDHYQPEGTIITNIERDHLDYYRDLEDIKRAFRSFLEKNGEDNIVVMNADDPVSEELAIEAPGRLVKYGTKNNSDYSAGHIRVGLGKTRFTLQAKGKELGDIEMSFPGLFNIQNALAAISYALEDGIDFNTVKKAMKESAGTWRRFETVGKVGNTIVVSDYAHHPTSVKGTIEAAREFYPGKRILAVFQPHHRNRTRHLFKDFVGAFERADGIVLIEIFDAVGREGKEDKGVSSEQLVEAIRQKGRDATYADSLERAEEIVKANLKSFDVILMMGAGDIYLTAGKIVKENG